MGLGVLEYKELLEGGRPPGGEKLKDYVAKNVKEPTGFPCPSTCYGFDNVELLKLKSSSPA